MTRKRNTEPEALLQMVITRLETSDEPALAHRKAVAQYADALTALLDWGPLLCEPTNEPDDATIVLVRAEVIAVLRLAVHRRESDPLGIGESGIALSAPPQFSVRLRGPHAQIGVSGSFRDLVVLQLVWILEHVGLAHVRQCTAPDCERLYVKTYRREFCSTRCQRRTNKRRERLAAREYHEQQRRSRRRRAKRGRG